MTVQKSMQCRYLCGHADTWEQTEIKHTPDSVLNTQTANTSQHTDRNISTHAPSGDVDLQRDTKFHTDSTVQQGHCREHSYTWTDNRVRVGTDSYIGSYSQTDPQGEAQGQREYISHI